MPVYVPTGKLGAGKTLWAMSKVREAIKQGKPIATNLDLFLEHLPTPTAPIYRLPDYPTAASLAAIGEGSNSKDELTFGWVVLDEAAVFLNSRDWSSGDRTGVLSWLRHARKLHWNLILLTQGAGSVDKQIRDDLLEYHVVCRRMDRMKVPFFATALQVLTWGRHSGNLPKVHMASIRYGYGQSSMHTETEYYQSKDLYATYDTDQKIRPDYPHGLHCLIKPPDPKPQTAPVRQLKPKLRAVDMVMRLEPEKRIPFMRSIEAKGLNLASI